MTTLKVALLYLLLIAAIGGAGVAGGIAWQSGRQNADLIAARTESQTCEQGADGQARVIAQLQKGNADRLADLKTQRALTQAALKERDVAQKQISDVAHARQHATAKVPHENADCQSLATLPVCSAVADRLWGKARDDVARGDTAAGY